MRQRHQLGESLKTTAPQSSPTVELSDSRLVSRIGYLLQDDESLQDTVAFTQASDQGGSLAIAFVDGNRDISNVNLTDATSNLFNIGGSLRSEYNSAGVDHLELESTLGFGSLLFPSSKPGVEGSGVMGVVLKQSPSRGSGGPLTALGRPTVDNKEEGLRHVRLWDKGEEMMRSNVSVRAQQPVYVGGEDLWPVTQSQDFEERVQDTSNLKVCRAALPTSSHLQGPDGILTTKEPSNSVASNHPRKGLFAAVMSGLNRKMV